MNKEMKMAFAILVIGLAMVAVYWLMPVGSPVAGAPKATIKERIILPSNTAEIYQAIPEVQSYLDDIQAMIQRGEAVLPLQANELDAAGKIAQAILLKDITFLKDTQRGEQPLHNDMMRIMPAIISVLDEDTKKACQITTCYQAEKYNFATNATTRAIVDTDNRKVLSVKHYPNMQPDISLRLTHIAQAIALNAPEVKKELGINLSKKDMSMANVRGALQESPCENSAHLCVAPTFADHKNERALWAVVDLTELTLAAAKWAGLGKTTTPACISERSLQNRHIMENFCRKNTMLEQNGWQLSYRLTGSDGLEVIDASFNGKPVLASAKIVDWHVSYQQMSGERGQQEEAYIAGRRVEFVENEAGEYLFGYNDAMGCPMFSTSVVLPFNAPQIKRLKSDDGFELIQDFRNPKWPMACNYRYENRFEFYDDGSFRVLGVNMGRGCGEKAIYRPVIRIDMAISDQEVFYHQGESDWQPWVAEQSAMIEGSSDSQRYKITAETDSAQGYYIEANQQQGDDSRDDPSNLFATVFKSEEGEQDLLTLGSCCNLEEDGVEGFINGETIEGENIVLWYVPRIYNDVREGHEYCWADTVIGEEGKLAVKVWPCVAGPKFVPIGLRD